MESSQLSAVDSEVESSQLSAVDSVVDNAAITLDRPLTSQSLGTEGSREIRHLVGATDLNLHSSAQDNPATWEECDSDTYLYIQVKVTDENLKFECSFNALFEDVQKLLRASNYFGRLVAGNSCNEADRVNDVMKNLDLSPSDILYLNLEQDTKSDQTHIEAYNTDTSSDPCQSNSSDDSEYCRPRRVRVLTKEERIIQGLSTGRDAPLEVREEGIAGRGVFATSDIQKGEWLCEYKTSKIYNRCDKEAIEKEYRLNGEGSYVVESAYAVPGAGYLCFDATRRYEQLGRYMNHARNPNAVITSPMMVRKKWRIGFCAARNIKAGEEVAWNYEVQGQEWSGCRLVDGVIQPSEYMVEQRERERQAQKKDEGKDDDAEVAVQRQAYPHQPRRRLCYCPIEGCTSKPLVKLSNHLSQVHHLNAKQRSKYLGLKRRFATANEIANKSKKTTLRRSQRTLASFLTDSSRYSVESPDSPSQNAGISDVDAMNPTEQQDTDEPSSSLDSCAEVDPCSAEEELSSHSLDVGAADTGLTCSSTGRTDGAGRELPSHSLDPGAADTGFTCSSSGGTDGAGRELPSHSLDPGAADTGLTCSSSGRTDGAGRFSLDEPFLAAFSEYLGSRSGGKKSKVQIQEICTDVSKYLWHVDSSKCDPLSLLSRADVRSYVSSLEAGGIGPSGLLTKLRRISMAIQCFQLRCEDLPNEREVFESGTLVQNMISNICTSLSREKSHLQSSKLERFAQKLPDLSEIAKFITCPSVDAFYNETVKESSQGLVSREKLYQSMIIVAGRIMLRNGQRPGGIVGMTLKEFEEGQKTSTPGYLRILVQDHKSNTPAKVTVSGPLEVQLKEWVYTLRPLYLNSESTYVFATESGAKLMHLSRSLTTLAKDFELNIPSATNVRKAIATKGGELEDGDKVALAHSMSHSVATADRYYRAYNEVKSLQGYNAVGTILDVHVPEVPRRQRFSKEQTELIQEVFKSAIDEKSIPSPARLQKFLADHCQMFPGRVRGDIYSKIRNLIGRKK